MNATNVEYLMRRFSWPWRRNRLIEQVGGEIARECREDLWGQVEHRIEGMSIPEARGYIRARAAGIVENFATGAMERRSLRPELRPRVLEAAVDRLVGLALHDALSVAVPAGARNRAA